ncbi:sensor histidine kinase [Erythrobacter sp. AP23]|uniref:sensor histidine kinase n=1 Tax=Erythrobacter sp. AP23 TaxID=499656 RepID=UPI00076C6F26|nr:HWE histidine kinase domain-containing protein [Erythrobacter sp. AP23]KWV95187.1 PAS domain S-box protein [Erythrobacter sp. AP23]
MYRKGSILWPGGKAPSDAHCDEDKRLAILAAHGVDALVDDPELQELVELVAKICAAPMALVTMVEEGRQLFLTRTGIDARETPRSTSFCAHAMLGSEAMEVCDAHEDERFADNALVTGPPYIRFYAGHPLISAEGAPLGALCVIDTVPRSAGLTGFQQESLGVLARAVMRRISQRRLGETAQEAVAVRDDYLQRMIDSVPGIAWSADASGKFDQINAQWEDLTGLPKPTTVEDWRAAIHPDDWDKALAAFEASLESGQPYEYEWRLKLSDGDYRWMLSRAVRIPMGKDANRWFGTVIDVDRQHRLSESRDLLANELSHRIKNIFAVVSGLVAIRSRGKPEVADFAAELNQTIRALGAAHDYVRPGHGKGGGTLSGLLADLLAPYGTAEQERFSVSGPGIKIGARAATPLALIFHELATNSAKYGALSCAEGHVTVTVEDDCAGGDDVCVNWEESARSCGIPDESEREGFGSRLLRMAVEGQLGGTFERTFSEEGLEVRIVFPRSAVES